MHKQLAALCSMVVAAACASPPRSAATPPAAAMPRETAREVMRRVVETYEALTSYQDEGVVLSHRGDKHGPDELRFKTYSREPDHFRFEFIKHHPYPPLRHIEKRYVIWSSPRGTSTYWSISPTVRTGQRLSGALAAATGVSRGSAASIPGLLLGDGRTLWSIADLRELSLLEPATFEGTPCVRIQGRRGEHTVVVWIGRDDFLIRRTVMRVQSELLDDQRPYVEEIRRHIEVNEPIADDVFAFTPPP